MSKVKFITPAKQQSIFTSAREKLAQAQQAMIEGCVAYMSNGNTIYLNQIVAFKDGNAAGVFNGLAKAGLSIAHPFDRESKMFTKMRPLDKQQRASEWSEGVTLVVSHDINEGDKTYKEQTFKSQDELLDYLSGDDNNLPTMLSAWESKLHHKDKAETDESKEAVMKRVTNTFTSSATESNLNSLLELDESTMTVDEYALMNTMLKARTIAQRIKDRKPSAMMPTREVVSNEPAQAQA